MPHKPGKHHQGLRLIKIFMPTRGRTNVTRVIWDLRLYFCDDTWAIDIRTWKSLKPPTLQPLTKAFSRNGSFTSMSTVLHLVSALAACSRLQNVIRLNIQSTAFASGKLLDHALTFTQKALLCYRMKVHFRESMCGLFIHKQEAKWNIYSEKRHAESELHRAICFALCGRKVTRCIVRLVVYCCLQMIQTSH